jgi:2-C-methyl-D-erythritol 4-phosphate cytidylyltransferase
MSRVPQFWVVLPAAGSARRMGGDVPKQYLPIGGRAVIELALQPFLQLHECRGIAVVLAKEDRRWADLPVAKEPRVRTTNGGAERADSVRAGLDALQGAEDSDWVLVHDAARPCLSQDDLLTLLTTLRDDEVGGLLAAPVVDTLKRASADERVANTIDRTALWRALTPQMFRFGVLRRALHSAAGATDDSQAVEAIGYAPKLVRGSSENIKVTIADDLLRAERILMSRTNTQMAPNTATANSPSLRKGGGV